MKATISPKYNVFCNACEQTFTPAEQSPLWWKAHQRATRGFLDALCVSGEECGCVKNRKSPGSPFRVFGYNMLCEDFDIPIATFTEAVRRFLELNRCGNTVFIDGVSETVERKIQFSLWRP